MSLFTLEKLLEPRSVAVVGASREPEKLGNIIVANIQASGFSGALFPINPNAKKINGLTAYKTYAKLPVVPDLAIVAVPADVVLQVIPEIAAKGTTDLVIMSAGFKEIGAEGLVREQKLTELVRKYKLRIIGPNCLGFVNNDCNLNATFGQAVHTTGNLRFITQSGAIATSIFDWAHATGVGFSSCVTLGNKTVIGENEILKFYLQKDAIRDRSGVEEGMSEYEPVAMYLESIVNGPEFISLASTLSKKNPVFMLKPGKSAAARDAMKSHTGALASDDAVLGAALEKAGVIRCDGLEDFFDLCRVFAWENAPKGNHIAIISNAGGPGVLTTDAVEPSGLELAQMSKPTLEVLKKSLPRAARIKNPIDVLGDALADRYTAAMEAALRERHVDALVVLLTPQVMTQIKETAESIIQLSRKYGKPIVCSFMGGTEIEAGERILNKNRIPSFRFPERAIKALSTMWKWYEWQRKGEKVKLERKQFSPQVQKNIEKLVKANQSDKRISLPAAVAGEVGRLAGFHSAPATLVGSISQALKVCEDYQYPVVLKISSEKALHKTEIHGVRTNLSNPGELAKAYTELAHIKKSIQDPHAGILLQKQVPSGVEVIAGIKHDRSFGPVLMFGAGGTLTELWHDTHLVLPPLSEKQLMDLVLKSNVGKLLAGYRGDKPYAVKKLVELLERLLLLAASVPSIQEVEINPIIVTHTDAIAVDTKIVHI